MNAFPGVIRNQNFLSAWRTLPPARPIEAADESTVFWKPNNSMKNCEKKKIDSGKATGSVIVRSNQDAVAEYNSEVSGHNVTNTHTPGKTSVQVTKAWADSNNQDGKRPGSVTIKLLADGKETDKTLTLTETNNWTDTFTGLDEYNAGEKIIYTVKEEAIGQGYTTVVTGDAKTGFIVTNVRTPSVPTIQIPCPPQCETGYVPCSTLPQKVHALPRTGETESGMWPLMLMMAGFILLILRKQRF